MLLPRAGETLTEKARRLVEVAAADDPSGKLQALRKVREQPKLLLRTGSRADASAVKAVHRVLADSAGRLETNKLRRTLGRRWKAIGALIVTGTTMCKVKANNTGIQQIKGTASRGPPLWLL
jgi:hypothetical protein